MSKLIASFFVSLDGVVEAPETWHFPYFDDEMGAVIGQSMTSCEAFLLGRRTYEEWAAYWPAQDPADSPLAAAMNESRKFVASRSLQRADWQNTTLLDGDAYDEVRGLKQERDGDILISGSATLVRGLVREGLVDELRLLVHPGIVGDGARLFDERMPRQPLELVDAQTFTTGVLNLTYRPAA